MSARAPQDERLMCGVLSLNYDFRKHAGELYLPDGHCCDMTGCVGLFEGIDSKVTAIDTYSGDERETAYRKEGTEWKAFLSTDRR